MWGLSFPPETPVRRHIFLASSSQPPLFLQFLHHRQGWAARTPPRDFLGSPDGACFGCQPARARPMAGPWRMGGWFRDIATRRCRGERIPCVVPSRSSQPGRRSIELAGTLPARRPLLPCPWNLAPACNGRRARIRHQPTLPLHCRMHSDVYESTNVDLANGLENRSRPVALGGRQPGPLWLPTAHPARRQAGELAAGSAAGAAQAPPRFAHRTASQPHSVVIFAPSRLFPSPARRPIAGARFLQPPSNASLPLLNFFRGTGKLNIPLSAHTTHTPPPV